MIHWGTKALAVSIDVDKEGHVWLRSLRPAGAADAVHTASALPLVEVRIAGEGSIVTSSQRQMGSSLSRRLCYVRHEERQEGSKQLLDVVTSDPQTGLCVIAHFCAYADVPVLRSWAEVRNDGDKEVILQTVSSLALGGLTTGSQKWWEDYGVSYANSTWFREAQWVDTSLPDVGLDDFCLHGRSSRVCFAMTSNGTWSSGGHLPMGALYKLDGTKSWLWQIDHNGSWRWEIGDAEDGLYMVATGPCDQDHQWSRPLAKGDSFESIPAAVAVTEGGRDAAFAAMTNYRRRMRRPHPDHEGLPIIFNDYMNCLMGDPNTEKVTSLIAPAAKAGAEYFCIDAGWYSDESGWWDSVGEWEPSKVRFPAGLKAVLQDIKKAGMVPGLWVEPEAVGVRSPVAKQLPEDAFFRRDGRRVEEVNRYQLDYSHPAVIQRMDAVVDRLVNEYGVGYFKFDYNVCVTQGTNATVSSPGDGLLRHNLAYLAWIKRIFERFPRLVIESCSSGGQRLDYALLGLHPIQSTSDQEDAIYYAPIAASIPTAVTPEQSATWAYPQPNWTDEHNAFTVVNALLGRVHLSGLLDKLSAEQHGLVASGMQVYKEIRHDVATGTPFWPLRLPKWRDEWIALGLECKSKRYVSVWRRGGASSCKLPIAQLRGTDVRVQCLFPVQLPTEAAWDKSSGEMSVGLQATPSARLFALTVV